MFLKLFLNFGQMINFNSYYCPLKQAEIIVHQCIEVIVEILIFAQINNYLIIDLIYKIREET